MVSKKLHQFVIFASAILFCQLAGLIGSVFNLTAIDSWYAALEKPAFSPPNWIFGPVWVFLFLLMGVSLYLVLSRRKTTRDSRAGLLAFGVQWVLNVLWSFFFFTLENPLWAFVEIILLLISILVTVYYFEKINKTAAYLLIPYVLWVAFAAGLNFSIVVLN